MTYTSNNWVAGDLITAAKMNNLEEQYTDAVGYINASTGITPISVSASSAITAGGNISGANLKDYISDPSTNTVASTSKMYMYYGGSTSWRIGFKKTYAFPAYIIKYGFYLSRESTHDPTGPIYAKILSQPTSAVLKTSTYVLMTSNLTTDPAEYTITMSYNLNAGIYYLAFELGTTTEGAWPNTKRVNMHYYGGVPASSESVATWTTAAVVGLSTARDLCGTRHYGHGISSI